MITCPKCGSNRIRRSQRRGIVEGLFLRLVYRAPFRCIACGTRFVGPYHARQSQRPKEPHNLLSFLGFPSQRDKLQRMLVTIIMTAVLIIAVITLVFRLLQPRP